MIALFKIICYISGTVIISLGIFTKSECVVGSRVHRGPGWKYENQVNILVIFYIFMHQDEH
jgi:hypothetical protein